MYKPSISSTEKYSSMTKKEGGSRGSGENLEQQAQEFETGHVSYFEKFQSNFSHNKSAIIDSAVPSSNKNQVTKV